MSSRILCCQAWRSVMDPNLTKDIIFAIIFMLYPGLLLFIAKQLEKTGWSKDATRKFVHAGMGVVILFVPFFTFKLMALIPSAIFILLNALDYKFGILSQIQGEDKGNIGTVLYPLSYLILIAIFFHTDFWGLAVLGILTMAIGDAAASVIGHTFGRLKYMVDGENRSYEGSSAMFFFTFILTVIILGVYWGQMMHTDDPVRFLTVFSASLLIAGVSTAVEALSVRGSDNLTVPCLTALTAWLLLTQFGPNVFGNQAIVNQPLF